MLPNPMNPIDPSSLFLILLHDLCVTQVVTEKEGLHRGAAFFCNTLTTPLTVRHRVEDLIIQCTELLKDCSRSEDRL